MVIAPKCYREREEGEDHERRKAEVCQSSIDADQLDQEIGADRGPEQRKGDREGDQTATNREAAYELQAVVFVSERRGQAAQLVDPTVMDVPECIDDRQYGECFGRVGTP